jgi:hypothetical protein
MEEPQTPPSVPTTVVRPTVSDTLGLGWATMKKFFPELILILFILVIFSLPMGFVNIFVEKDSSGRSFFEIINFFYGLIIMAPLQYGAIYLLLKAIRGEEFHVNEMFNAYRQTLQIGAASLLVGVIVVLGLILLIVPGIIFACRLAMVPYLVMDRKMQAVEAVRKSWEITKGHSWSIFGLGFTSFWIIIAGVICLVVGVFPAIIWVSLAFAAMYEAIAGREQGAGSRE